VLVLLDYQITIELIEILLEAGAQWPYTLADTYVVNNLEILRMETMTQYLKSEWVRNSFCPEVSFQFKQLISFIDALELKYKRKEKSDLLFFGLEDSNVSNIDLCCKALAYYELFVSIQQGNIDELKVSLALGVDPNYRLNDGLSILSHIFSCIPFLSTDIALKMVTMLLDAGAKWTDKEFEKLPDPKLASLNPGTMTNWMLQYFDLYKLLNQQHIIDDYPYAQRCGEYSRRCKEIALFLDNYELIHKLKEQSEIV